MLPLGLFTSMILMLRRNSQGDFGEFELHKKKKFKKRPPKKTCLKQQDPQL